MDIVAAAKPEDIDDPIPYVVGIGASAGGLEAIRELMKNVSSKVNATYVVVQHMAPKHRSLLTTLIGRETHLEVLEIEDGVAPLPSTVYVTPPNNDVILKDGVLRLVPPSPELAAPKPSVDRFFISLAEDAHEHAVGVVLSGTGSDGSYGVQAIRSAGGFTIAQDDRSAKYNGMPMTAVETGCVDLILSPIEIGTHLSKILSRPRNFADLQIESSREHPISDLLQILLVRTRVDFREYKSTTVQRRIERRMTALGIKNRDEYTAFCRSNPTEVDALFKDLLISVTRFFRDAEDFEALGDSLHKLVREKDGSGVRIWVAGCATGEEVYSIAILMAEAMGGIENLRRENIQIFASDIDSNALKQARTGYYALSALNDIPDQYRDDYFVRQSDGVQVVNALREIVLFSNHNVCQDPPFLNIDLICCRNLLIYFSSSLQRKVLTRLHYSLNEGGLLFLGAAESVTGSDDMFLAHDGAGQIFKRQAFSRRSRNVQPAPQFDLPRTQRGSRQAAGEARERAKEELSLFEGLTRALGPDALLVSSDYRIQRVFGEVSPYITLAEGDQLAFSLAMLKPPMAQEARTLVTLALKNGEARKGLNHDMPGDPLWEVQLSAYPLDKAKASDGMVLLTLSRWAKSTEDALTVRPPALSSSEAKTYIERLEREVESTREAFQRTVEQLEAANRELQMLNQELQSTNEELQATNEELETSNEELQSTNEELVTVNEEFQVNASELSALTDELASILENIGTPVLVVDTALQVSHASRDAVKIFNLSTPFDRPHVSQLAIPSGMPALPEICNEALRLGQTITRQISADDIAYNLFCTPYSDNKGRLAGASLILMETPEATRLHNEMSRLLETMPINLMRRARDGTILRVSGQSARQLEKTPEELIGMNLTEVVDAETAAANLADDAAFLDGDQSVASKTISFLPKSGGEPVFLRLERSIFDGDEGEPPSVYSVGWDITEERRRALSVALLSDQIELAAELTGIGIWSLCLEDASIAWSPEVFDLFGRDREAYVPGFDHLELYAEKDRAMVREIVQNAIETHVPFAFEAGIRRTIKPKDIKVKVAGRVHFDEAGAATHLMGVIQQI